MALTVRDLVHFWPVPVAAGLVAVQPDVVIAFSSQWQTRYGLGLPAAIVIVQLIATAKMCWSYWFWGWLRDLIADTTRFQRLAILAKQAARLVKGEGLVDRAFSELKLRHDQAHTSGTKLLATARWFAYLTLFGIGIVPGWGVRGPWVIIVGVAQWRQGLYALVFGNMIRVAYLMGGIKLIAALLD